MRPKQLLSEKVQLEPFQIKTFNLGFVENRTGAFSIIARYEKIFCNKGFYAEFQGEDQSLLLKVDFTPKDVITGRFVNKERILEKHSIAALNLILFSENSIEFEVNVLAL